MAEKNAKTHTHTQRHFRIYISRDSKSNVTDKSQTIDCGNIKEEENSRDDGTSSSI